MITSALMAAACKWCGRDNPDGRRFCQGCGQSLPGSDAAGPSDPLVGSEILGSYRIDEVLGQGGMSVVYRGHHIVTDQPVAIKALPPELAGYTEVKARFVEEARTLARLEHPNIVLLYNFVEEGGALYLVMQFSEGETLDVIITRQQRVSVADTAVVGIEVCRALAYAHQRGVIHRDIKPSNIIIRGDNSVKVMDFGIAKIVGSTKLTQTGQTMGTVSYMSPEQVRGKSIDHRTDVYSLGVTLYESLCGRTPFDADNHYDLMRMHLTELPPPPSDYIQLPAALETLLLTALEKRPEKRFESAQAMLDALERVPIDPQERKLTGSIRVGHLAGVAGAKDAGQLAMAETRQAPRRRRRSLAVGGVLLVASAAAVFWASLPPEPGGKKPATVDAAPAVRWPAVHPVARSLRFAVDQRFVDARLSVMSMKPRDTKQLVALYRRAQRAYRDLLAAEGVQAELVVAPLNLVIVPQEVLNRTWSDAKPRARYDAPTATLYVNDGRAFTSTDLMYGLALHFCARLPYEQFSNRRCQALADRFERYVASLGGADGK